MHFSGAETERSQSKHVEQTMKQQISMFYWKTQYTQDACNRPQHFNTKTGQISKKYI